MAKEKHICNTIINQSSRDIISRMINRAKDEICGCNAKYNEEGIWYCGRHAPSKVKEREDKSFAAWKAKLVKIENFRKENEPLQWKPDSQKE